jgi:hypothetical protein
MEVLFGSDGVIKYTLLVRGLGFGLDEEALKAARMIEFKPGEVEGQPVSMWMGVDLGFARIEIERKQGETPKIALNTAGLISLSSVAETRIPGIRYGTPDQ